MKVTLGPLQSHVMSCNLILGELLLGCPGFWHPKVICWDVFYPTQDAKKLVTTRTRMTSFFFFFRRLKETRTKTFICHDRILGISSDHCNSTSTGVDSNYNIPPSSTSPLQKGTTTLDHFTTSRDSGLGGLLFDCGETVLVDQQKIGGPDLDDH